MLSRRSVKVPARSNARSAANSRRQMSTAGVEPLFNKILIANRGEIAIRVMKTAKRMGIKTVAVYSDADRGALFTKLADEAIPIGGTKTSESYLKADKILQVAKEVKADAIHPGYGFLSENSHFVEQCEQAGIVFIGPPPKAMDALGDKLHSKKIAKDAGVSIVPGFIGEVSGVDHALKLSKEIGYPVMIKAASGGGGKGMRLAYTDDEVKEGFRLARQEAQASFGSDRILIEKFIDSPRHIEFQILADGHGNAIYLPERECSIQRRNQKVVEEAPSPFVTPEVRKKMGEQAVALAKAVNYKNTGTVEFLIDPSSQFYFLEMNTRLQVEHPITEAVTNIDIVEHMIRVAAGEKLALTQKDVQIHGWAMESRIYAEDPLRNFLPSIGRLTRYQEPTENDGEKWIRVDSGIVEGSEISIYYDPLIAKLITSGKTREQSITRMAHALDSFIVRGLTHNVNFLRDVMQNARFKEGRLSTKFIPEEYPKGFKGHVLSAAEKTDLIVVIAALQDILHVRDRSISGKLAGSSDLLPHEQYHVKVGEEEFVPVGVTPSSGRHVNVTFGNASYEVDLNDYQLEAPVIEAKVTPDGGVPHLVPLQVFKKTNLGFTVQLVGTLYNVDVVTDAEVKALAFMPKAAKVDTSSFVACPMAGQLVSVAVSVGETVAMGQEIAVVEAMKMQNVLRSPRDGVVKAIKAEAGKAISLDQVIVEFQPLAQPQSAI